MKASPESRLGTEAEKGGLGTATSTEILSVVSAQVGIFNAHGPPAVLLSDLSPGPMQVECLSLALRVPPPLVVKLITSPSLHVTLSLRDLMIFHPWSQWN